MPKRYWILRGNDGVSTLFEYKINANHIGEKKLKDLIRALTSKISLSEEEIIDSYVNKNTRSYCNNLEIQSLKGKKHMYSCGTNPFITATLE